MTKHSFGGIWTKHKLDILREYLAFYTKALKDQPFQLLYIDSFAGSGRCDVKINGEQKEIDGSAKVALDIDPPFNHYCFIERKRKHVAALEALCATHRNGARAVIAKGEALPHLKALLSSQDWKGTRGVLFLDPYGLQCDWGTIMDVATTRALDVFFLVSVSGIYRQATNDMADIDDSKEAALDRFLGTTEWRHAFYSAQQDLFAADPKLTRNADSSALLRYIQERMAPHFGYVADPVILYRRGVPIFGLVFAVSNPQPKAVELAKRVSKGILTKLRQ